MVIIIMILTINVTVLLLRKKYNNNQNPFHVIPIINLLHWKVSRKSKRTSKNFQISYEVGANCLLEFKAEFVQFGGELVPIKKQLTAFSNCGLQSLNCGVQVKKYMFIIESLIVKTDRTLIYSVVVQWLESLPLDRTSQVWFSAHGLPTVWSEGWQITQ